MSTWREALKAGEEMLVRAGVPDGAYDAWALMEFAFAMEKSYYFLHADDKMEEKQRERYQEVLEKRAERIPLQQITGSGWFMGYEFYVNDHVLIPRFDTEILVEEAGKLLKQERKLLDLCTGSGCVLLSLLAEHRGLNLTGAEEALLQIVIISPGVRSGKGECPETGCEGRACGERSVFQCRGKIPCDHGESALYSVKRDRETDAGGSGSRTSSGSGWKRGRFIFLQKNRGAGSGLSGRERMAVLGNRI